MFKSDSVVDAQFIRALVFALVGSLVLFAPQLGAAIFAPFAVIALLSATGFFRGPVFRLLATPDEYDSGRPRSLLGLSLATAALALATLVVDLSEAVFVATVLVVTTGQLGAVVSSRLTDDPILVTAGYVGAGGIAAVTGQLVVLGGLQLIDELLRPGTAAATVLAIGAAGALTAALMREMLFEDDAPLIMLATAAVLWVFAHLLGRLDPVIVVTAVVVTVILGWVSYVLGTASVAGMIAGVLLGYLVIVLGGFSWFAVLMGFFGVGALSTKYRYRQKQLRGVAEANAGARGTGNVLGNAAVAMAAVAVAAASTTDSVVFLWSQLAFAGAIATALADTLSSEVGGLYDTPRLITTFQPVPPGTDGAVTTQGEVAGLAGAVMIAGVATLGFGLSVTVFVLITIGAVVGMHIDSLLGATVEDLYIGNEMVNLLATLVGALVTVALAVVVL